MRKYQKLMIVNRQLAIITFKSCNKEMIKHRTFYNKMRDPKQ